MEGSLDVPEDYYEIETVEPALRPVSPDGQSPQPCPEPCEIAESIASITSSLIPQTDENCHQDACLNCPGQPNSGA